MRTKIIIPLALLLIVAGCKNQMSLSNLLNSINGQKWQVQSLNGQPLDADAYDEFKGLPELTFNDDGVINGHSGCNGFRADYKTDDNQNIEIRPGAMTKMHCQGVDENGFLEAINSTRSLKMDGQELILVDSEGTEKMRLARI
jgi:heat shock protein HslJ